MAPIHPFKLDLRVSETDTLYAGSTRSIRQRWGQRVPTATLALYRRSSQRRRTRESSIQRSSTGLARPRAGRQTLEDRDDSRSGYGERRHVTRSRLSRHAWSRRPRRICPRGSPGMRADARRPIAALPQYTALSRSASARTGSEVTARFVRYFMKAITKMMAPTMAMTTRLRHHIEAIAPANTAKTAAFPASIVEAMLIQTRRKRRSRRSENPVG